MPHLCTNCGRTFPDGSKEMLSGCPDCGGNKFQYQPSGSSPASTDSSPSETPEDTASESDADAGLASRANASVRDWVRNRTSSEDGSSATAETSGGATNSAPRADSPGDSTEDRAQADARRDVVSPDELAEAESGTPRSVVTPETSESASTPDEDDGPDLSELRAELNDQFESIKIVDRGQYELNLMELYDREEYIISLREDGHYVIEVSDPWRDE